MKRNVIVCLSMVLILSTTHRAPAPISEESPTPTATAKQRPAFPPERKAKPRSTARPKPTPISFAGVWDTNFNNQLRVSQNGDQVTGLYDGSRGVLNGTISGNVLSGTWAWKNQTGVFRFILSSDGNSFTGTWNRSDGYGGAWTGVKRRL